MSLMPRSHMPCFISLCFLQYALGYRAKRVTEIFYSNKIVVVFSISVTFCDEFTNIFVRWGIGVGDMAKIYQDLTF